MGRPSEAKIFGPEDDYWTKDSRGPRSSEVLNWFKKDPGLLKGEGVLQRIMKKWSVDRDEAVEINNIAYYRYYREKNDKEDQEKKEPSSTLSDLWTELSELFVYSGGSVDPRTNKVVQASVSPDPEYVREVLQKLSVELGGKNNLISELENLFLECAQEGDPWSKKEISLISRILGVSLVQPTRKDINQKNLEGQWAQPPVVRNESRIRRIAGGSKNMHLLESKNLDLYKRLVRILGQYSKSVPATGIDRLFDQVVAQGMRVLPKDKFALTILDHVLCEKDIPNTIQTLLNLRFSDLPVKVRPMSKKGRRHEVAFWSRGDEKFDRVKELLDFEGAGKAGKWTDPNGEAVQLIDLTKEEKKES